MTGLFMVASGLSQPTTSNAGRLPGRNAAVSDGDASVGGGAMAAELSELRVRDVKIRLHRAGKGPTMLFLHGAGGVPQWLPFFDMLADGYEVLVPLHPGFAGSDTPNWIRSLPDLAMFYLDLEKWLHRIKLPALVIWGSNDRIMPPAYAGLWRERLPDARIVMIEGCGHLPHVEQAAQVGRHVRQFLEGV